MTKATYTLGTLSVFIVLLHGTLMPYIAIFGGRVNVLVALVVAVALNYGTATAMIVAIATGLLADTLFASALGLTALPLVVIGYTVGQVGRRLFRDEPLVAVVISFTSIAAFELLTLLLSRMVFGVWWGRAFVSAFVPTWLVNVAALPVLITWLGKVLPQRKHEVI